MEALETQTQATQEKENAVTKQNMKYTMSSSRGIYLSWLTGRIYSTIQCISKRRSSNKS